MKQITSKIVGYKIVTETEPTVVQTAQTHTLIERPPLLLNGTTYKIKPSNEEHSYYITINNLNNAPFEIFINSKNTNNFQFISALTRMVSAIFRKGGNVDFVVEELTVITAPNSGYWGKDKLTNKGKYYNSLIHEIGDVIKYHLGVLKGDFKEVVPSTKLSCPECKQQSAILLDNCLTCLDCGYSKCG